MFLLKEQDAVWISTIVVSLRGCTFASNEIDELFAIFDLEKSDFQRTRGGQLHLSESRKFWFFFPHYQIEAVLLEQPFAQNLEVPRLYISVSGAF